MTPEQRAAIERIADLLQEIGYLVGEDDEDVPEGGSLFLNQWVLVCSWVDQDGGNWMTKFSPPGVAGYQEKGLLHEALHNWG